MKKGKTILRRHRKPLQGQAQTESEAATPPLEEEKQPIEPQTSNDNTTPPTSPSADPNSKKKTLVFRPRKVNWERPLLIFRPQELQDVKLAQRHMAEFGQSYGFVGSSTISKNDFAFLNDETKDGNELEAQPETRRLLHIPIPTYTCLYGTDDVKPILQRKRRRRKHMFQPHSFVYPKDYIKASSLNAMDIGEEYDMTSDDEDWLTKVNSQRAQPISEASFERIVAIANRMSYPNAGYVSAVTVQQINQRILKQALLFRPQPADSIQQQLQKDVPPLYEMFPSNQPSKTVLVSQPIQEYEVQPVLDYWTSKNQHKFKQLQQEEDAIFQAEQKLRQLQVLRQEFEKARLLLELVCKRERTKKKWVEAQRVELNLLYKYKKSGKPMPLAFTQKPVETIEDDPMDTDESNEIESNRVRSPAQQNHFEDESTMEEEDDISEAPKVANHSNKQRKMPRKVRRAKKRRRTT